MQEAILCGWLHPNDVLVCDNAAIHNSGINSDLEDFLWNTIGINGLPLRILLLPLPTQSPELNPIELVWNTIVMRVRHSVITLMGAHAVARMAELVMNQLDLATVIATYRHCGYHW